MGFSSAVNWWEESQLRILVLSSLGIQYLLAIFAGGRRFHVPRWYRFLAWLCYLGSDAVAIYALATLFNRQRQQHYKFAEGSRDLEVLWAPILLMHLGGQVLITAYNLEDNELWKRHIVTALSQITVALYVFCKSWSPSADRRLLAASILLFILGIAKCIEKSWCLKGASFNNLASDSHPAERTPTTNREKELEDYIQEAKEFILADHSEASKIEMATEVEMVKTVLTLGRLAHGQLAVQDKLFIDSAYPYSDRMTILKAFFTIDNEIAYSLLREGLTNIFTLLYTKTTLPPRPGTRDYKFSAVVCNSCTCQVTAVLSIVVISLFHSSHKQSYRSSDVIVSLVLLYGTFLLDFISFYIFLALNIIVYRRHTDIVDQHSLIRSLSRHKSQKKVMKSCDKKIMKSCDSSKEITNIVRGYVINGWKVMMSCDKKIVKSCDSSKEIINIVRGYVINGWKEYITDAESYQKFNDMRGYWKLRQEGCDEHLGWSLEKPFDESVLLWHMATDFCFHHMSTSSDNECASRCREISNYMMHLLFVNPEMLMVGSRRNLFKTACDQLEHILKGEGTSLDEKKLTEKIIFKIKSEEDPKESFIQDAWVLAQGLIDLGIERKMWEVIQGVWVEMLCFSASRCRGYLHAKSLGSGVEYLSYVWLLLSHSGMETLSERLQRTPKCQLSKEKTKHPHSGGEDDVTSSASHAMNLPKKEDNNAGPSASQVSKVPREEKTGTTSSASQGEDDANGLDEIVVSQ